MLALLAAAAAAVSTAPAANVRADSSTMQTVEVTVGKAPVLGDMQSGVLDFKPEFFTPVRPATSMDMIRWLPGFTFEDTRDLRGLGGATGNVLIDGQPPTSKTDTLQTILTRIPSSQVERIDLIVGGSPGIDMRGHPIIANVILRKSATARGVAQVQGFVDQHARPGPEVLITRSLNREGRLTEWSFNFGRQLGAQPGVGDGPWLRTDGNGNVIFDADVRSWARVPFAILTGAHERPMLGGKVKLNGTVRYSQYQLDETDTAVTPPAIFRQRNREDFVQGEVGLRYERPLGARTTLETQVLERRSDNRPRIRVDRPPIPSYTRARAELQEEVGRATLRFKPDETLTIEGSAEAALNGLDSRSALTLGGVPTDVPGSDVNIRERRADGGVTVTWKPSAGFSLTGAIRGETSHLGSSGDVVLTRSLSYLKPRAVFSYAPDKETQVRLRVEREVAQINFYNFAAITEITTGSVRLGNPDLKPQAAWVAEAVFEKRFWNGASVTLTARRSDVDDVVDAVPLFSEKTVVNFITNIGPGKQTDLIWALTLPLKRFGVNGAMIKGGMTWTRSRVTDPTTGERRRFNAQSAVVADGHFTHDLPRWRLTWGVDATYFGRRLFYRPTSFEDSGYNARVNLFVERRATPTLTIRVELGNITDFSWPQHILVYGGTRGASPLLYRDDKDVSLNQFLYVRVRKTFS